MPIHHPAAHSRRGFTLVELLVALLLFDCALLAFAGDAALLTRAAGVARRRAIAAAAAGSTIEQLRAIDCPVPGAGQRLVAPGVSESWSVAADVDSVRRLRDSVAYGGLSGPAAYVLQSAVTC
jgi:type II secretory pathway pseudopilin PulG